MPILIFRGTTLLIGNESEVIIHCPIKTGIVWIGALDANYCPIGCRNYISINGDLHIYGNVRFGYQTKLILGQKAKLILGGENSINHDCVFLINKCVTLAYGSSIGWNTQICDNSFHYICINNVVSRKTKPIVIGRKTWVSSYCNITKGACLPDYSVLSNCSLLNKDFSSEGSNLLIGGIPARVIKRNTQRIMEFAEAELCDAIDRYFDDNPLTNSLDLTTLINEDR